MLKYLQINCSIQFQCYIHLKTKINYINYVSFFKTVGCILLEGFKVSFEGFFHCSIHLHHVFVTPMETNAKMRKNLKKKL